MPTNKAGVWIAKLASVLLMKRLTSTFIVGVLCLLFLACGDGGGNPGGSTPSPEFTGALPNRVSAATPRGVLVMSNDPIDASLFASIDAGLDDVRTRAAGPPNNYANVPVHSQFTVGLFPRSNKCIDPGFTVRMPDGHPWDGTVYDKDPQAGRVLLCVAGLAPAYANNQGGINDPSFSYGMLVVNDAGIMRQIVDFEAEHEILFCCDINKWWATAGVHAHPLIPSDTSYAPVTHVRMPVVKQTMRLWLESEGQDSLLATEREVIMHLVR